MLCCTVTPRISQNNPENVISSRETTRHLAPKKKLMIDRDRTGDLLFAIGVGFLINFLLGAALPEIGAFIAGTVAGVMVKEGPLRGGIAGFLAGTLGGIASLGLWVATNLISLPTVLLPLAFEYAVAVLTAEYAILSLSGGIIGSVVVTERWAPLNNLFRFFKHGRVPSFPTFPASPSELDKQED